MAKKCFYNLLKFAIFKTTKSPNKLVQLSVVCILSHPENKKPAAKD